MKLKPIVATTTECAELFGCSRAKVEQVLLASTATSTPLGVRYGRQWRVAWHNVAALGEVVSAAGDDVSSEPQDLGALYVIAAAGTDWVKVGRGGSPKDRLRNLQCGCPLPLVLIWSGDEQSGAREPVLHQRLRPLQAAIDGIGEWFDLDDVWLLAADLGQMDMEDALYRWIEEHRDLYEWDAQYGAVVAPQTRRMMDRRIEMATVSA